MQEVLSCPIVAIIVAVRARRADSQKSAAATSRMESAAAPVEDNAQMVADAIQVLA